MTWFELPRRSRSSKEDDHVVLRGEMGQRKTKKVEVRNDNGIKRWQEVGERKRKEEKRMMKPIFLKQCTCVTSGDRLQPWVKSVAFIFASLTVTLRRYRFYRTLLQ